MSYINVAGTVYGDLTALEPTSERIHGNVVWKCACVCGNTHLVSVNRLRTGITKSCGCRLARVNTERNKANAKHNHAHTYNPSPTYRTWTSMINRCEDPSHDNYHLYGGRGITICDKWRNSFVEFLNDMGERPKKHTIDRIDNNGNYEPDNCRWATAKEQNRNRCNNKYIEFNGKRLILVDWAAEVGIKTSTLRERIRRGWSAEKTLTTPTICPVR